MKVKITGGAREILIDRVDERPIEHMEVTNWENAIDFTLVSGKSSRVVSIPKDGNKVFVENDNGKTIDRYSWPRESKQMRTGKQESD